MMTSDGDFVLLAPYRSSFVQSGRVSFDNFQSFPLKIIFGQTTDARRAYQISWPGLCKNDSLEYEYERQH